MGEAETPEAADRNTEQRICSPAGRQRWTLRIRSQAPASSPQRAVRPLPSPDRRAASGARAAAPALCVGRLQQPLAPESEAVAELLCDLPVCHPPALAQLHPRAPVHAPVLDIRATSGTAPRPLGAPPQGPGHACVWGLVKIQWNNLDEALSTVFGSWKHLTTTRF